MKTIKKLEILIDQIDAQTVSTLDRNELAMLKRAKIETMALLTTLRYINQ